MNSMKFLGENKQLLKFLFSIEFTYNLHIKC